jgi:hypothetical protein
VHNFLDLIGNGMLNNNWSLQMYHTAATYFLSPSPRRTLATFYTI